MRHLASGYIRLRAARVHCESSIGDVAGKTRNVDVGALIDSGWLRAHTPLDPADVYLCRPHPFMRRFVREPVDASVPGERIRCEFFGPSDEALAA
ncbi:hypothetical protein [Lysobacter antibioticus]|uniref:hypothetical protein n=1 Tax=Lysobacter antibioticus TaxID=84531 RepID=UPI0003470E76|nr:hypothetical protein [Lysobacter antibioticus]